MEEQKDRYIGLDGLRAVSVLMVFNEHCVMHGATTDERGLPHGLKELVRLLQKGQLGVSTFFVVSGFLITSLLLIEEKRKGSISLANFYTRRAFRLLPAFFVVVLCYVGLQLVGLISIGSDSWLTTFLFVKYINYSNDWYTAHFWSLSIEHNFYLFWPICFITFPRHRVTLCLVVCVVCLGFRMIDCRWNMAAVHDLSPLARLDSIAMGCLLALSKPLRLLLEKAVAPLALISLLVLLLMPNLRNFISNNGLPLLSLTMFQVQYTIGIICISVIVFYTVNSSETLVHRLLENRILSFFGQISYSFYLWQMLFTQERVLQTTGYIGSFIITFSLAAMTYKYIELPFIAMGKKFIERKRSCPSGH